MIDLVKQLREMGNQRLAEFIGSGAPEATKEWCLEHNAADEIERLGAVVEALKEGLNYEYPLDYRPLAEALAALDQDDE